MPGFDWFANMDAVNIDELGWALEGDIVLARDRANGGWDAGTGRGRSLPR